MARTLIATLAALLLAAAPALQAQTSKDTQPKKDAAAPKKDAAAPKKDAAAAKTEGQAKMQERWKKTEAACEAKKGDERRACIDKNVCAGAKDPAACESHRKRAHEACKGKTGDALKSCRAQQAKTK